MKHRNAANARRGIRTVLMGSALAVILTAGASIGPASARGQRVKIDQKHSQQSHRIGKDKLAPTTRPSRQVGGIGEPF